MAYKLVLTSDRVTGGHKGNIPEESQGIVCMVPQGIRPKGCIKRYQANHDCMDLKLEINMYMPSSKRHFLSPLAVKATPSKVDHVQTPGSLRENIM